VAESAVSPSYHFELARGNRKRNRRAAESSRLDLVRAQRSALENEKELEFSIELIREKIAASQETLNTLPNECGWSETVHRLDLIKKSLKHRATDFTQLRLLEAVAAQIYFAA
jgi:CRISPR/Cas system-associated endonuclease Cas1